MATDMDADINHRSALAAARDAFLDHAGSKLTIRRRLVQGRKDDLTERLEAAIKAYAEDYGN